MILFVFIFALVATACTMATEHAVNGPDSASRAMVGALVDRSRALIVLAVIVAGAVWLVLLIIGWAVQTVGDILGSLF